MEWWRLEWGSLTRPGFARMGMWLARPRWCDGSPRMEWYMGATIYSKHATLQPRSSRPFQLLANKCATLSTFFLEVWSIFPFIWLTSMTRTAWRDQNLTDANTKTYFSSPKKSFRLLSPSGDLGIGLVWDNVSPPDPHFSVRLCPPNRSLNMLK